jgi:hypothetical protein
VEKVTRLNRATQFSTVVYDGSSFSNISVRMDWFPFGASPCEEKTRRQLTSRCCWNRARRLTCFVLASVTRKDLQFGKRKDPSFQRHYKFHPTSSGNRSN